MNKEEILKILAENNSTISNLGVKSLGLFGSVSRGERSTNSDADFIVSFHGPVTFDRFMDVKIFLEDLLGMEIDLVIAESMHPEIKANISEDIIYVA